MFVVSCSVLIECAIMTEAAWRSLCISFAYKHASLICTSLSQPKAVHISGVHCSKFEGWIEIIWSWCLYTVNVLKVNFGDRESKKEFDYGQC